MSLQSKLTSALFGRAVSWVTGHARLIIEYMLIACVVALGVAILYGRIHLAQQDTQLAKQAGKLAEVSQQLDGATDTIKAQVAVNKAQQEALDKLDRLRDADSTAIAGLQHDVKLVNAKRAELRSKLDQLEKNNAKAKALLDTPVPPSLGCLLDDAPCPAASTGHHEN